MNDFIRLINPVILLVFIAAAFLKCLDYIYLFQIKEYRFDRFVSYLREEGIGNVLYFRYPRIPSKSPRNILLMLLSLFFILVFPADLSGSGILIKLFLFLTIPILALFFTIPGVVITGFLAAIHRNSIIDKAEAKLKKSNAVFIGVTGSYGKSSVKEFIYQILSAKFKTAKTDENMNTDVGVSLSILKNLQQDTEFFVAEMGAYRIGEIKKICGLVHPKYGILTAIGNQHISLFGSQHNIEIAKTELLNSLPEDGGAYINAAIKNRVYVESRTSCRRIYYSSNSDGDITASEITHSTEGVSAKITYKEHSFTIQTKLVGRHVIENLLPAVGLGIDLGISTDDIKKAIFDMNSKLLTLSVEKGIQGATILNDAKNSNVEGFIAAVKTASDFSHKKKYIISKGIIELGAAKGESYKRIVNALNDVGITLITTDPLFIDVDKGILVKNETDIIHFLKENVQNDSLVVIEGRFTEGFLQTLLKN